MYFLNVMYYRFEIDLALKNNLYLTLRNISKHRAVPSSNWSRGLKQFRILFDRRNLMRRVSQTHLHIQLRISGDSPLGQIVQPTREALAGLKQIPALIIIERVFVCALRLSVD